MIVQELIRRLSNLDPLTEVAVCFDGENEEGQEGLCIYPIEKIEEIITDNGDKFILLEPYTLHGTDDVSKN